jgi:hypothetical protein
VKYRSNIGNKNMSEEKVTLSGNSPDLECSKRNGAPQPIDPVTGMHKDYWVLSSEERAKGFVRPVRQSYRHVGSRPRYPLRELTEEEKERYNRCNYIVFETYLDSESPVIGRFWTKEQLNCGCNTITTMNISIAETYARDPKFYGATFCSYCRKHFPVGENGEFVWNDGSGERVGT